MNDKDKEAFENAMNKFYNSPPSELWQAACDYKQKEIDELLGVEDVLRDNMNTIGYNQLKKLQDENANLKERIFMKTTLVDSLKAENTKLRECVEFYAEGKKYQGYSSNKTREYEYYQAKIIDDSGKRARQCLKELEDI